MQAVSLGKMSSTEEALNDILLVRARVDGEGGKPGLRTKLSKRFNTPCRRRAMLASVFVLTCFASGPVTSWPTFEPILGDLGVLGSTRNHSSDAMNEVYNIGQGIVLVFGLPMGLMYDVVGPSMVTAVGGLFSGCGLLGMALSISAPRFNNLLFFTYPLAVAGGGLVSYSIFGFIWLFPSNQTFVGSLNTASLAVSDASALLGVYMHNRFGLHLVTFFVALAIVSAASACMAYLITPSREENRIHFILANNREGNFATYDSVSATDSDPDFPTSTNAKDTNYSYDSDEVDRTCSSTMSRTCMLVKNCWKVVALHPVATTLIQIQLCLFYFAAMYPVLDMYNFWVATCGENDAIKLVNVFPVIYGTLGAVFNVIGGHICDRVGLERFVCICTAFQIASSVLVVTGSNFIGQLSWLLVWMVYVNMYSVIFLRYAARYAPFELFGTYMGVLTTIMALPQLMLGNALSILMGHLYPNKSSSAQYTVAFSVLNVLACISTLAMLGWWWRHPPPEPGYVTLNEVGDVVLRCMDNEPEGTGNKDVQDGHSH